MVNAHFDEPDGNRVSIDIPDGWSLMEGARQEVVRGIVAECGGGAICGTCHVRVGRPWFDKLEEPGPSEAALLTVVPESTETSRLACQIMMTDDMEGIEVSIPSTQIDF